MKTSVDIPDHLWRAAKHLAIEKGTDLKGIIVLALEKYLKVKAEKNGGEKE
jgi:hypothetical protein